MNTQNGRMWMLLAGLTCIGCVGGEPAAGGLEPADPDAGAKAILRGTAVELSPTIGEGGPGTIANPTAATDVECIDPDETEPPLGYTSTVLPEPGSEQAPALAAAQAPFLVNAPPRTRGRFVRIATPVADTGDRAEIQLGTVEITVTRRTTPGRGTIGVGALGVERVAAPARTRSTQARTTTQTASASLSPTIVARPVTPTLNAGDASLAELEIVQTIDLDGVTPRIVKAELQRSANGAVLDTLNLAADLDDCEADAFAALNHVYPSDMPPVRFPPMDHCSHGECVAIKRSWIRAHHHVWWVHRAVEFMNALHPEIRRNVWSMHGERSDGSLLSARNSSFANWFGEYDSDRFHAVREAINHLWTTYRTGKHGLVTLRHQCPHWPANAGNACFTAIKEPSGQHIVLGKVNYCPKFFGYGQIAQLETTIHEPIHHVFVHLNGVLRMVKDTHNHYHGNACLSDVQGGAQYGTDKSEHLAQYLNGQDEECNHRSKAVRNVSNYDGFVRYFGESIWNGHMAHWPSWPEVQPTPQPPQNCTLGDEGCQCAEAEYDDVPDGDFAIDMTCSDHDGEMSCTSTKFGTQSYGVCTRCEGFERAGGCTCESTEECAPGLSCFGADTHGGGIGHCYDAQPPSWACLADCQRLYNDDGARCVQDYPTGGRCVDSLCSNPKTFECFQQGMVCRYGDCVVECDSNLDCQELGYPSDTFQCISHECRRANWL